MAIRLRAEAAGVAASRTGPVAETIPAGLAAARHQTMQVTAGGLIDLDCAVSDATDAGYTCKRMVLTGNFITGDQIAIRVDDQCLVGSAAEARRNRPQPGAGIIELPSGLRCDLDRFQISFCKSLPLLEGGIVMAAALGIESRLDLDRLTAALLTEKGHVPRQVLPGRSCRHTDVIGKIVAVQFSQAAQRNH